MAKTKTIRDQIGPAMTGATKDSDASAKFHGERCEARRAANRPWDKDGN